MMTCKPLIRLARLEDAAGLHRTCWREKSLLDVHIWLLDVITRQERGLAWGLVAVVDDTPVAYGQVFRWMSMAEISDLIVGEPWRGHGIGTALIWRLVDIARQEGLGRVEIGVAESNARALALYRRLGFCEKRRVLAELGQGPEPVIYLCLPHHEAA
jgi:ribosomal protein S18 acetylase RimI-like enzyme